MGPYVHSLIWSLISVWFLILPAWGQFPRECATVEGLTSKICCPVNQLTGDVCGGLGRGSCLYFSHEDISHHCHECENMTVADVDDRVYWPSKYFNQWCQCEWPFTGPACDKCAWGYYGDECDEKKILTRKNIKNPENEENLYKVQLYLNWMKFNYTLDYVVATCTLSEMISEDGTIKPCFKNVTAYNFIVYIHWWATVGYSDSIINNYPHTTAGFLTWHRHYMLLWERFLQEISGDFDFALPYWKWTGDVKCSICDDKYFGRSHGENGTLDTSVFSEWQTVCRYELYIINGIMCDTDSLQGHIFRHPGRSVFDLPTDLDMHQTLAWFPYDRFPFDDKSERSFRNVLYGNALSETGTVNGTMSSMHIHAHGFFDGTMDEYVASTPNDPIFSVFHCFVDYMMDMWIWRYGEEGINTYPRWRASGGSNWDDYIVGFFPPVTHGTYMTYGTELGYDYEPILPYSGD